MLHPRKVKFEAKKREDENLAFRTYLKCNADEKELDQQFAALHKELFKNYDCSGCRNCCMMYHGSIKEEELEQAAGCLNLTKEKFKDAYLQKETSDEDYQTIHKPCDFLEEDGSCILGDCKPECCKKYPYIDQTERLWSLYSVLETVEVCPVAFEIFEQLKKEYGFRWRGR